MNGKIDTKDLCLKIHKFFSKLPKYKMSDIKNAQQKNPEILGGVYVMFEEGETYHGYPRITRIGTHQADKKTAPDTPSKKQSVWKRMMQHYGNVNSLLGRKDGSIFRKNIGIAMLNKSKDPYVEAWLFDRTTPANREKYDSDKTKVPFNKAKQDDIEKKVSSYIRNKISFVVVPINSRKKRHDFEYGLISAICRAFDFIPSKNWLGNFNDKEKIQQSHMWVANGIDDNPLTDVEFEEIKRFCKLFK